MGSKKEKKDAREVVHKGKKAKPEKKFEDSIKRSEFSSTSKKRKKRYSSSCSTDSERKVKKKKRKRTTSEDTSSSEDRTQKTLKKKKAKHKKKTKKKMKEEKTIKTREENSPKNIKSLKKNKEETEPDPRALAMRPMTQEEWEKRQSVMRHVYDAETGRTRLVKGDGEIMEEIVSRERHLAINKQATIGDGNSFQAKLGLNKR